VCKRYFFWFARGVGDAVRCGGVFDKIIAFIARFLDRLYQYQLVSWWHEWHGFKFYQVHEDYPDGLGMVYDWCLYIGFWEIRKWRGQRPKKNRTGVFLG